MNKESAWCCEILKKYIGPTLAGLKSAVIGLLTP